MSSIVSPLFFYFAMIADVLNFMLGFIGFLGLRIAIVFAIILCCMYYDGNNDEDFYFLSKKIFKWSTVVTAISFIAWIFMPSKEVLIEMEVAKYATPDNIKSVATEIIKVVVVKEML